MSAAVTEFYCCITKKVESMSDGDIILNIAALCANKILKGADKY